MKKSRLLGVACACLIFLFTSTTHATLVSRLGGLAFYDTESDLTWLANANAAVGSAYDILSPGSGLIGWTDANAWVAGLNVSGVTGWRLPDTLDPDASCGPGAGSHLINCTGSEMGNLFYNVLGNTAGYSSPNTGPFSNVQIGWYWSGTPKIASDIWVFNMYSGDQNALYIDSGISAWAVQSGDVGAVPIPPALWLFGSGLLGLIGVARKKTL